MKRVRTAKGRKPSSIRWLERQLNDPYVRRAKAENYRSRAAYKLLELDERFGLLKGAKAVVDLGIAPGGWSQVVRRRTPGAKIAGIDLLPTDPIDGATILEAIVEIWPAKTLGVADRGIREGILRSLMARDGHLL